ncbi:MAG: hemolysin family protein [Aggregatilineales bacterium]
MLATILIIIVMIVLMIGFNALYVAGEFATVSARKSRIMQLANEGNTLAKLLLPVLEDHHKLDSYIAASQVGITISSVVLGIFGQQQIAPRIEPLLTDLPFVTEVAATGVSATLVLILLTTLQVVLGELVPKSLALQYPERVALLTTLPMKWSAEIILKPLIVVLNGSGTLILRLLGIQHNEEHKHVHSPEEIQYLLLQSHQGGLLDEQEHTLLDSAFRFGKLRAGEIIIPRTKMVAADVSTSVDNILRLAAKSDYTRIPIYEGDIDHIIGFVHLKELFQLSYRGTTTEVRGILRDMTFVHHTTMLDDVWDALNKANSYLAIVSDEYGGTVGLITREDLMEELFGEVQDEFDEAETSAIAKIDDMTYRIRGDVSIRHINDDLNLSLETDDSYTIGGYFLNKLGHMAEMDDEISVNNVRLRASVITDRAVEEIMLTIENSPLDEEGER